MDVNFYRGKRVFITGHTGFKGAWLCHILRAAGAPVTFREISSTHGHDSFLFPTPDYHRTVAGYLDRLATAAGVAPGRK